MPCGAPRRCFRTLGYYGQEGAGRALRAGGKIRLARAFFVLGKVRAQSLCDLRTMLRRRVPRVLTRARAEQDESDQQTRLVRLVRGQGRGVST